MTGSENRGEKQPGRVRLQTGPGRDAIAKSEMLRLLPGRTNTREQLLTAYRTHSLQSMIVKEDDSSHDPLREEGADALEVRKNERNV
jgi:hypothetical protein